MKTGRNVRVNLVRQFTTHTQTPLSPIGFPQISIFCWCCWCGCSSGLLVSSVNDVRLIFLVAGYFCLRAAHANCAVRAFWVAAEHFGVLVAPLEMCAVHVRRTFL